MMGRLIQLLLSGLTLCVFVNFGTCFHGSHLTLTPVRTEVVQGIRNTNYTNTVNNSVEYLYQFSFNLSEIRNESFAGDIRIDVESSQDDTSPEYPILFVARQQKQVLSWQLPITAQVGGHKISYNTASRTLCNDIFNATDLEDVEQTVFVSVSTASTNNVTFSLKVFIEKNFSMRLGKKYEVDVSPTSPRFFQFMFPNVTTKYILLEVDSVDKTCMTVSVQNVTCPVRDQEYNVEFTGYWQTMMTKAGMTISRNIYPLGFYVVFVVHAEDTECTKQIHQVNNAGVMQRIKTVTFSVSEKIRDEDYIVATTGTFGVFSMFWIAAFICSCLYSCRAHNPVVIDMEDNRDSQNNCREQQRNSVNENSPILAGAAPIAASSPRQGSSNSSSSSLNQQDSNGASTSRWLDTDSSLDEVDVDWLPDAEKEKDIFRTKASLCVAALARKNPRILRKKAQLYLWTLFTVAMFYALPVVQLVFTYQKVLHTTGNQDLCYYNYLCAHPYGILSDFNHVYSNIGYVMLGVLFIVLTNRRNRLHENMLRTNADLETNCGIPRHFGLFYAMGGALVMEGVLSACYHVCPNYSNFQFDTCFMYVIAMLCILKVYQTRHPDINASAYMTFACLALVIFIAVLGVMVGSIYFWAVFTALHVMVCLFLSFQIYYLGRWKLDVGVFQRVYHVWKNDCLAGPLACLRPLYIDRMALLVLANGANWGIAAVGLWKRHDFASHLLMIFMANLLLYMTFYIIMKLTHRERILFQPFMYMIAAVVFWSLSLFVFLHRSTSWQMTPAESRTYNRECLLLGFYDTHDIWHFLSAASMFFSFMLLLTLDDDLALTPRTKIAVF